jgi:hypothetical protein
LVVAVPAGGAMWAEPARKGAGLRAWVARHRRLPAWAAT